MSFLALVVDCCAENWAHEGLAQVQNLQRMIASVLALANAHMISSISNQMLVIASGVHGERKKIFSNNKGYFQMDNSSFGPIQTIEMKLKAALIESLDLANKEETRKRTTFSSAIALTLCAYQRYKKQTADGRGQVVIINCSRDLSSEQNQLMSLWFSARSLGVRINVASLAFSDDTKDQMVPILSHACDVTGGLYIQQNGPDMLAHNLTKYFLIDTNELGQALRFRQPDEVDYRASCHCHSQLVKMGWVCTVCLAVHCPTKKPPAECVTCGFVGY